MLLIKWAALAAAASFLTCLGSVPLGTSLAVVPQSRRSYTLWLLALLVPFSLGSSVWGFGVGRLAELAGVQSLLLFGSEGSRSLALLALVVARSLPLGVFFCATGVQQYAQDTRPYFAANRLVFPLPVVSAWQRTPRSLILVLGLFAGGMMGSEAAVPVFLYRANPGTPPETVNLFLMREFRESYGAGGPEVFSRIAGCGLLIALVLLAASLLGTLLARRSLDLVLRILEREDFRRGWRAAAARGLLAAGRIACLLPATGVLMALAAAHRGLRSTPAAAHQDSTSYLSALLFYLLLAAVIVGGSMLASMWLRYRWQGFKSAFEKGFLLTGATMLPAFLPALSIAYVVGRFASGSDRSLVEFGAMSVAHVVVHLPVFLYLWLSIVADIEDRRVLYQRAVRMSFWFSVAVDCIRRAGPLVLALLVLCVIQLMMEGSVSRWFGQLMPSPEEALFAAAFGRLGGYRTASEVALAVAAAAIAASLTVALSYAHRQERAEHA